MAKIIIELDVDDVQNVPAVKNFLSSLIGENNTEPAPAPKGAAKDAAKPAPKTAVKEAAKPAPAPAPAPKEEEPIEESLEIDETPEKSKAAEEPKEVKEKTYTIEEVRSLLASKVSDHREEIKTKLNSLGSPNVTNLDPAKYGEFVNFLNSLD